jgi:hypothetical protein
MVLSLLSTGLAQSRKSANHLPSDLLFTTGDVKSDTRLDPHNILARIDAETLEVTPFYTDKDAYEVIAIN